MPKKNDDDQQENQVDDLKEAGLMDPDVDVAWDADGKQLEAIGGNAKTEADKGHPDETVAYKTEGMVFPNNGGNTANPNPVEQDPAVQDALDRKLNEGDDVNAGMDETVPVLILSEGLATEPKRYVDEKGNHKVRQMLELNLNGNDVFHLECDKQVDLPVRFLGCVQGILDNQSH